MAVFLMVELLLFSSFLLICALTRKGRTKKVRAKGLHIVIGYSDLNLINYVFKKLYYLFVYKIFITTNPEITVLGKCKTTI